MNHIPGGLKQSTVSSQHDHTLGILRDLLRISIMIGSILLPFCHLHLTGLSMTFQIGHDHVCKRLILIFFTVCDHIKLIHLIHLFPVQHTMGFFYYRLYRSLQLICDQGSFRTLLQMKQIFYISLRSLDR